MQEDEEIGKVAAGAPIVICKSFPPPTNVTEYTMQVELEKKEGVLIRSFDLSILFATRPVFHLIDRKPNSPHSPNPLQPPFPQSTSSPPPPARALELFLKDFILESSVIAKEGGSEEDSAVAFVSGWGWGCNRVTGSFEWVDGGGGGGGISRRKGGEGDGSRMEAEIGQQGLNGKGKREE